MQTVKWLNSSIWPINGILTGATTPGQSEPKSNGNESVLHITQSFRTEASPLDCLLSYTGHLWREGLTPLQSAYFTAPAN